MVKLIAIAKGFALGRIIAEGEPFNYPDKDWEDTKNRPKWAREFGAKASQDTTVEGEPDESGFTIPEDWQSLSAAEKKALAKAISGRASANAGDASEVIIQHLADNAVLFDEAPAATVVKPGSGLQDALGATQPDWVAKGASSESPPEAVTVAE